MKTGTRKRHSFGLAELNMAQRLKQLRTEKGLSLGALAKSCGMSSGFLSRVENHKMSLPIGSLERVAAALQVPIKFFFEEESERVLIDVCRKGEGARGRIRGPNGFVYESLVGGKKGKLMEPILVNLAPDSPTPDPKPHAGEEFDYVVEGECELTFGRQKILLRSGDSAYYDATVPHTARAIGKGPCKILVILVSRDYLFHGDLSRLLHEG
jgi:transcriptional regulator with XRE-family HTH domain